MKTLLTSCLLLVWFAVGCQSTNPTVFIEPSEPPIGNVYTIYQDKRYSFVNDYGYMEAGRETNSVFLFDLKHQLWHRIRQVSLTNAKLGRSPGTVQIAWDFSRSYSGRQFVALPIEVNPERPSGFAMFP